MNVSKTRRSSACIALLTPYDGGNLGDGAIQDALIRNFKKCDPRIEVCGITLDPVRTSKLHRIPCYPLAAISRPHYYPIKRTVSPDYTGSNDIQATHIVGQSVKINSYARLKRIARIFPVLKRLKTLLNPLHEFSHVAQCYKLLRTVDVLAIAGGGQLDEEWGNAWGHPYALLKWTVLARMAGSRVVFLSVGTGRVDSLLSKFFFRKALSLACYRSYRDDESRRVAIKLTRHAQGSVVPDLAFSLPVTDYNYAERRDSAQLRVGVSPIAYAHEGFWPSKDHVQYQRYMNELASFVSALLRSGVSVTLFSSSSPDEQLFQDLRARLDPKAVEESAGRLLSVDPASVHDLFLLLATVDFVVASRLHGLVLSFLFRKPSIAISYERKVRTLMDDLGQAAYCYEISSIRAADLLAAFHRLQSNKSSIESQLSGVLCRYDQLAQSQYREIAKLLLHRFDGAPQTRLSASSDHRTHESI